MSSNINVEENLDNMKSFIQTTYIILTRINTTTLYY